jgi:penicillin-binding protein 1C
MTAKRGIISAVLALALLICLSFFIPFPKGKLNPGPVISLRIEDRNGILLREVLSDEGGRCRWLGLADIPPLLIQATIAAEDRHFFLHHGVDGLSIIRALWQNIRQRQIVSGASTITQQLVRNLYPGRRNYLSKVREVWLAIRLERTLSKKEILVQYLNRISYGNQAYGIEAAASLYFDKPARHLSLAEATFLAAIPRAPTMLNPYRSLEAVKKRQRDILAKMHNRGMISLSEMGRARSEHLQILQARERFRAPHFCEFVLGRIPTEKKRALSTVRTTLDYGLQEKIEILVKNYLDSVADRGITNGALIVMDNEAGEILAMAGSKDFFDELHDGQVNGVLALRQPGSTLKPFTYGLALERGLTAASIVEDSPAQFDTLAGGYTPQNYDRKFHGPMSLRTALACSYNVPAVAVLQAIGPDLLYRRLKSLGFDSLRQNPGYYGVGLTLGNGEVTLLELSRAYSSLARQGLFRTEKAILELRLKNGGIMHPVDSPPAEQIFSPQISFIVTDILADRDARIPSFGYITPLSFPFPVAAKTGTTKDFRDNWTIGYSPRYTVGVWVGNFDGRPMHLVSGITGCGPLFKDVMLLLHGKRNWDEFAEPPGLTKLRVCPVSGEAATEFCPGTVEEVFIRGTEPRILCSRHSKPGIIQTARREWGGRITSAGLEVTFPRDGDIFKLDPVLRKEHQLIRLKASLRLQVAADKVEWFINGQKIGEAESPYSIFWHLKPGSYTIKARAMAGGQKMESATVRFTVLI